MNKSYHSKVLINGRFLTQPKTGTQRYAYELVRAWDEMLSHGMINPKDNQLELLAPRLENLENQLACIPLRKV